MLAACLSLAIISRQHGGKADSSCPNRGKAQHHIRCKFGGCSALLRPRQVASRGLLAHVNFCHAFELIFSDWASKLNQNAKRALEAGTELLLTLCPPTVQTKGKVERERQPLLRSPQLMQVHCGTCSIQMIHIMLSSKCCACIYHLCALPQAHKQATELMQEQLKCWSGCCQSVPPQLCCSIDNVQEGDFVQDDQYPVKQALASTQTALATLFQVRATPNTPSPPLQSISVPSPKLFQPQGYA